MSVRIFGGPSRYVQVPGAIDRLGELTAGLTRRPVIVADADVLRKGVAAQHRRGLGRIGTDQGDTAGPGERQGAVVGEQDDRLLSDLAGQLTVPGPVQVDRAAQGLRILEVRAVERGRHRTPAGVQQAEESLRDALRRTDAGSDPALAEAVACAKAACEHLRYCELQEARLLLVAARGQLVRSHAGRT